MLVVLLAWIGPRIGTERWHTFNTSPRSQLGANGRSKIPNLYEWEWGYVECFCAFGPRFARFLRRRFSIAYHRDWIPVRFAFVVLEPQADRLSFETTPNVYHWCLQVLRPAFGRVCPGAGLFGSHFVSEKAPDPRIFPHYHPAGLDMESSTLNICGMLLLLLFFFFFSSFVGVRIGVFGIDGGEWNDVSRAEELDGACN